MKSTSLTRRHFLAIATATATAAAARAGLARAAESAAASPRFLTRGVVLTVGDMSTLDWPARAEAAGLTTLATHIFPHEIAEFLKADRGLTFLADCRKRKLRVEHELHAMNDLLPRKLFEKDPNMFRMDDRGQRVGDYNLCIHSEPALQVVCENVAKYSELLRPTTGRYFYWIDDGMPMCRCPNCRGLSDSDQALILENRMLKALRGVDPQATLAHLAYARTLAPPTQVKPEPGIFLEFAPIERRYDVPLSQRDAQGRGITHGELLDSLDANLEVFGRDGTQALEYWLDESRFASWNRDKLCAIPWNEQVYLDDLKTYSDRGIRHITTFAAWIDAKYVASFGEPPVKEYGAGMQSER
jgi:hypothetical protein